MSLSPALTGAIAGAIAGSIASTVTNAAVRGAVQWVRATTRRVVDQVRDDHQAIQPGTWPYHCPPDSSTGDVWVQVICAPSRSLRRPKFDVGRAAEFVHAHYPAEFPDKAWLATTRDGVQFNKENARQQSNGLARVCTAGRLDLTLPVQVKSNDTGQGVVDVVELLRPIRMLAAAAASPDYNPVYNVKPVRCGRRFDWSLAVSISTTGEGGTRQAWEELRFPGREPSRAGQQRPFCPRLGYAAGQLVSRRITRSVDELLRAFLVSYLEENGYHDTTAAIDEVLATPSA